jgi:uroporphyrinogen III methyltransferase/synthase
MQQGKVVLLGAGPGDPELLTQKGISCLKQADVIVYDALACPSMLNLAKPSCTLIFAGKLAGHHFMQQQETNLLLAKLARAGKYVVRLKGGDPFVFGRGGEEAEVLLQEQIPFEIVSGVSSCYSAPAYAGIPVTHRDYASSFHVITGHKKAGSAEDGLAYETLAKLSGTLVFLMSLTNLPQIAANLMAHGKDPQTPAAVIQQGTTARQRVVTAPLCAIAATAQQQHIGTPALTVIGDVVTLHHTLQWLPQLPLTGKKIIATGTPEHARMTAQTLRRYGAETAEISLIDTTVPEAGLLSAIDWDAYRWVVLTSSNGVRILFDALVRDGVDLRRLMHLKFAVIGTGTARALREKGFVADCIPERFESKDLAEALIPQLHAQERVLLLRAENGSTVLQERLAAAGVSFTAVPLYRTAWLLQKKTLLLQNLADADYLLFASASAVRAYAQMVPADIPCPAKIVSIGAVTTQTAQSLGIPVAMTAKEATIQGIADAILQSVASSRKK